MGALGQISLIPLYGDVPSLPAILVASNAVDDGRAQPSAAACAAEGCANTSPPPRVRALITPCASNAMSYYVAMAIQSFKCAETAALFQQQGAPRWANIGTVTLRKLRMMHAAHVLLDLRIPPGNHLEALQGKRQGQHSIRINDQWRICFIWTAEGPADVEIVDYH